MCPVGVGCSNLSPTQVIYRCAAVTLPLPNSKVVLAQRQPYRCAAVNNLDGSVQGKRIMTPLDIFINFYQIISLLSHTDFTKLTKTASQKARSCRLCRVPTNLMASTSVASALRELREICVKINHLA